MAAYMIITADIIDRKLFLEDDQKRFAALATFGVLLIESPFINPV